jgi:pimeloyl-ACP methyl ester carboxylesterase
MTGGRGGAAGAGVAGSAAVGGSKGTGECCADGNCLCHGPEPTGLTSKSGPYKTTTFTISTGTVHYPTNAEPPFAGVAVCGGFLNTGPEMAPWGPFYASYGIVTVITTTTGADLPDLRATKLLASIKELDAENTKSGSPLNGKLAGRYGTSGYSMGGGGTTIASGQQPTLRTSVGLAPWAPTGANVTVPTLLLCGASDTVAPCSMAQGAYTAIAASTPKMMVTIPSTTHFDWFGPTDAGGGISGEAALAFQKVYLEGDERWKPLLSKVRGEVATNIQ